MTTINKFVFFINMLLVPISTYFAGYAANDNNLNPYKVGFFLTIALINLMSAVSYVRVHYAESEEYNER